MPRKEKILCIDDDPTIQALVVESLSEFLVTSVSTLKEALSQMQSNDYSAILIDIQLPDGDGLRFLSQLSSDKSLKKIPFLILSSHTEISNKVMAFTYGAEDFIAKPFDPVELQLRVSSKVKRLKEELDEKQVRTVGNLMIDFLRQKAFQIDDGEEKDLNLTSIELKIISLLTKRLEQVYTREQILDRVWGNTAVTDRTVDSHVAHLRQKINTLKVKIETSKNFGYRATLRG